MRRFLAIALGALLLYPAAAGAGVFQRWLRRGPTPYCTSPYKLEFANSTNTGMSTECANQNVFALCGQALTTTRATTATCTKADGTLVTIDINKPVVSFVPSTSQLAPLNEPPVTNPVQQSETLDTTWAPLVALSVTVTPDTTVDPYGSASSADTVTTAILGSSLVSNTFTISATSGAISIYTKTPSGTQAGSIVLWDATSLAVKCTANFTSSTVWTRQTCIASGTLTSGHSFNLFLYPGGTAGTGTTVAWGAQAEPTAYVTSYTGATLGSSVTRNQPFYVLPLPSTVTNTAGCWRGTSYVNAYVTSQHILTMVGNRRLGTTSATAIFNSDNTNLASATITSLVGRAVVHRAGWQTSDTSQVLVSDAITGTATYNSNMTGATTTITIGSHDSVTTRSINGYIYNVILDITKGGCL